MRFDRVFPQAMSILLTLCFDGTVMLRKDSMNDYLKMMSDGVRPHAASFCGMCLVSMDHSPSEQITDRDEMYTTVLVVSPSTEHSVLANAMGMRLRPGFGVLRKWAGSKKTYRGRFWEVFADELSRLPVFVFSVSATRSSIIAARDHFIAQSGLGPLFSWEQGESGRVSLRFGPYFTGGTDTENFVHMPENRALMVLFIWHFFVRVFAATQHAVSPDLTWCVYMDKFPGGVDGSMANLFGCLLDATEAAGSCVRGHFLDSDLVETDLLADNLAGFIAGIAASGSELPPLAMGNGGAVYWERWN